MSNIKGYEEPQMMVLKMQGDVVVTSGDDTGDTNKKPVIPATPGEVN